MKSITRRLGPDIKILFGPTIVIIMVILLSVVVFKNGYSQVRVKLTQHNEAKQSEATLNEKLNILREVRVGVLDQADATLIALPTENPAALIVSNLRTSASEKAIVIKELKIVGLGEDEDIKNMEIKVSTENQEFPSYVSFLKDLVNSAPIQSVKSLNVQKHSVGENLFSGELEINIFWANLPVTLPELTVPIQELTDDQKLVLAKMQSLKKPVFTNLTPSTPKDRPNPFN
ncbi:hypothetical protein A2715_01635 [Candidatus Woesebacteria bacterium RIFCSPHIGHO2_01_FULL_39_32]|uniref:Uncharacterized protein n=2 Tax=Candidatus Woeseibacteriota TaxID=1752722 RepID=A0A0G0Q014_9BACT|nr:MAG: hypothetical protein UT61_C0003G0029 [Candidatus Woesebacteria bacterium GW2011_GWA1_39_8]OGM23860.1 MAG: hypothetical protein A2715_01635 [Candidatus Woesebacteria bacterium RIFCSPHIGHO2_01_FULL_39_32]OGM38352.1 MAG: hypothetical protein A3F01_04925 [Candidatus Woesebacteria bacterium RIFCSPHIGHO2_12_FULL_38_11]OGM64049.1 MAG: hypothetical protein A2893_02875 [Candidatus Woesebacteria bacterium RIFCSPLOWO2_01_FULL_39_25]